MLKRIRVILAVICFIAVTALFVDFSATAVHGWGWLAKWQFMPAVLSANIVVLAILVIATLVLGRAYCSILCPLGVFQDFVSWLRGRINRRSRSRFKYSPSLTWLRLSILALFTIAIILGFTHLALYLDPYSAYGRIVGSLFRPVYDEANNLLATTQGPDDYTFYHVNYYVSVGAVVVAAITFIIIAVLAWSNGRIYCNTICPVGTILGYLSKFSWLKPVIDTDKCIKCGSCARRCKASCIDFKNETIDYSRCVACMDCLGSCSKDAISYSHPAKKPTLKSAKADTGRRDFLTVSALLAGSAIINAEEKNVDGGLAKIIDKVKPERKTLITPPGSEGHSNFFQKCTACQLCISNCPNGVLRPSSDATRFMQPEVSYERGYCRPECTRCSEVCPTGAISLLDVAEKSSVQIGHAVWIKENCLPYTDGTSCGNCGRHCPTGAIVMTAIDPENPRSLKVPSVNIEACIGCGACENLCPVRPFSAIYVEGHERHREI
ncbi:MAG: 4Fe-4S binding protein [Muribaculum sp.]|nr:4Fe-4S binding protein [Muribaculum sp.]